jgi:hypothetical protein
MLEMLILAVNSCTYRPAQDGKLHGKYGTVIASGFSVEPPPEVVRKMRETYGFDDEYEEKLVREARKQRTEFAKAREVSFSRITPSPVLGCTWGYRRGCWKSNAKPPIGNVIGFYEAGEIHVFSGNHSPGDNRLFRLRRASRRLLDSWEKYERRSGNQDGGR